MDANNSEYSVRLKHLQALESEKAIDPFPHTFHRTHSLLKVCVQYASVGKLGEDVDLKLYGRVMNKYIPSDTVILVCLEDRGSRLQFVLHTKYMPMKHFNRFKEAVSRGDWVHFSCDKIFRSDTGELTLQVLDWGILAPSLEAFPYQIDSLTQGYDQLYALLATNLEIRRQFTTRSRIVQDIRRFLEDGYDFLEVKTPPTQSNHHANTGGHFQHCSPDSYLKQLIVGGLEAVYELYDNVDSGVRWTHYLESKMLECYLSPANINDMMSLTERLITELAYKVRGSYQLELEAQRDWEEDDNLSDDFDEYDNFEAVSKPIIIDLTSPWCRRRFYDIVSEVTGVDFINLESTEEAVKVAREVGLDIPETHNFTSVGGVAMYIADELIYEALIQPTFITDYPAEEYPLTKKHPTDPQCVERFVLFINGVELANAYTELNDPRKYETMFALEAKKREHEADGETIAIDHQYINALRLGLPPTSGLSIGVDRLIMLLTSSTDFRNVCSFPLYSRW